MISKRTLILANWKMNMTVGQSSHLLANYQKNISGHRDIEVVVAPSLLSVQPLSNEIDRRRFRLAAQNAYFKDEGGFTGEVSFSMLRDLVHYVIIGHSERRIYFNDSLEDVREKIAASIRNDLKPVLCIGETSTERLDGQTKQVLHDQLVSALSNLTAEEIHNVSIAYEPVWAISSFGGKVAKPDEMEEAFKYIRSQVKSLYGDQVSEEVRVLYGGSVDNHNARSFLQLKNCDGLLVGSASLNYHKFSGIVEAAYRHNREKK